MSTSTAPALEPSSFERAFRDALGRFATGVAVVTAAPNGEREALVVNTLVSVSLEPPLIAFCPSRSSLTWCRMRKAGRLGVSVLGAQHEEFAQRASAVGADRFAGVEWTRGAGDVPLVADALATIECRIVSEHAAGDHSIVVARVDQVRVAPVKEPLLFFASSFIADHATGPLSVGGAAKRPRPDPQHPRRRRRRTTAQAGRQAE